MKIYTIGDSHCWHTWLKVPNVTVLFTSPMTMYRFGQDKTIHTNGIPEDAALCFCLGEIDCRCHVNKHQPWMNTIDDLVSKFINTIELNAKTHKNIWIYNVVPPPRKNKAIASPDYPFNGTDEERLSYVKYMNNKLRQSGYLFVDVYDKYSDPDGFLRMEISDGHVHVEDETYLIEWLKEKGLL